MITQDGIVPPTFRQPATRRSTTVCALILTWLVTGLMVGCTSSPPVDQERAQAAPTATPALIQPSTVAEIPPTTRAITAIPSAQHPMDQAATGLPSAPASRDEPLPFETPVVQTQGATTAPADPHTSYTVYLSAAYKEGQAYRYSCEFDAGWVILQSYGIDVTVPDLIARMPIQAIIHPTF